MRRNGHLAVAEKRLCSRTIGMGHCDDAAANADRRNGRGDCAAADKTQCALAQRHRQLALRRHRIEDEFVDAMLECGPMFRVVLSMNNTCTLPLPEVSIFSFTTTCVP